MDYTIVVAIIGKFRIPTFWIFVFYVCDLQGKQLVQIVQRKEKLGRCLESLKYPS